MCVGVESLQYDISADILPRKILMKNKALEKRSIQISYSPILDEFDIVLKLMLVIEDVTELEALEKEVIESQEASAVKVQKMQEIVLNNKREIKVFIREAILNIESACKSIKDSQISEFLRAAHTLKGNARIYNLSKLSEEIHHIETHLIQLKNKEIENNEGDLEKIYNQLYEKAYHYIDLSKEIFGHDVDETVIVQGEDFFEIEKSIFFSTLEEVKEILSLRGMPDVIEKLKKIEYDEFKKSLFGLHKIINKISFALKKDLSLNIKGDEIYLDKRLTSIIKETLIHIIQNSADHGIKEKGKIEIVVLNKEKSYHIDISDDGQGIDENIIYKKAVEKGLIKVEETEDYKKEDSLNLIFLPGFSTKNVATEFSGRGIGMDVVKTNITGLGGSIKIESEIGKGTLFKIDIPKSI